MSTITRWAITDRYTRWRVGQTLKLLSRNEKLGSGTSFTAEETVDLANVLRDYLANINEENYE